MFINNCVSIFIRFSWQTQNTSISVCEQVNYVDTLSILNKMRRSFWIHILWLESMEKVFTSGINAAKRLSHRFSDAHQFEKPNDIHALQLMNKVLLANVLVINRWLLRLSNRMVIVYLLLEKVMSFHLSLKGKQLYSIDALSRFSQLLFLNLLPCTYFTGPNSLKHLYNTLLRSMVVSLFILHYKYFIFSVLMIEYPWLYFLETSWHTHQQSV